MPRRRAGPAHTIRTVAIIGSGTMGTGIAQRLAQAGVKVVLIDLKKDILDKSIERMRASLAEFQRIGRISLDDIDKALRRVSISVDFRKSSKADLVIECVWEDIQRKRELFEYLKEVCDERTIFASNTSTMSITEMARSSGRPDRFAGLHFFYPAERNRLVEVIPGKRTSEATADALWRFSRTLGMVPIRAKDSPGFAVNRIFVPWVNIAMRLVEYALADIPTVEATAKEAFGIPMGPFELMNATGIPTAFGAAKTMESLGPFYKPSAVLGIQYLAQKPFEITGSPVPEWMGRVRDMLMGSVFYCAGCLLDEKVATLEDIERGTRIGLRWPAGPFELMNRLGAEKALGLVEALIELQPFIKMPRVLKAWKALGRPWAYRYVELVRQGRTARVIVNRPEAMNAINAEVLEQLGRLFDKANKDRRVSAIVLEGVGKAFMAGADVRFFLDCIEQGRVDDIVALTGKAHALAKRIDSSKKLVIAKLDGAAMGGGAELAMVADVIVASERACIGFPETGIGLYPGLGGTQRLPRIVGRELAKYLIFTGRKLDPYSAREMGLVQYIVPSARLDDFVMGLARMRGVERLGQRRLRLKPGLKAIKELFSDENIMSIMEGRSPDAIAKEVRAKAPVAIRLANMLIDDGMKTSLDKGLGRELSHLKEIFSTKDALVGLRSVGKGRPEFKGD